MVFLFVCEERRLFGIARDEVSAGPRKILKRQIGGTAITRSACLDWLDASIVQLETAMPITRDQASRLLTQSEMGLFGDSRNPALRALSEKALAGRVERTRKLRDKSRDLLQRQKLKSRERTGSKLGASGVANLRTDKKGEILDDILQRFESRLQEVQSARESSVLAAGKSPSTGVAVGKGAARKTASGKASDSETTTARKGAARAPAANTRTAGNARAGTTANASKPAKRVPAKAAHEGPGQGASGLKPKTTRARSKMAITPERAMDNTRALLEAKQQRERNLPAYLTIDTHAGSEPTSPGFQSGTAKTTALELHQGEMRMDPIHGSISTHGRKNQGKRDKG